MKKIVISLVLLFVLTFSLLAQENTTAPQSKTEETEMADKFRADGKIYVVVGVAAILFTGLLIYLVSLDRKVRKMEDELEGGAHK